MSGPSEIDGPQPLLVVDRLGMTYGADGPTPFTAIDEVSLAVQPGEFVCIVGPSGAGKTTMLRCLSGLIAPTKGEVRLLGKPVAKPPRAMALVFQDYSRSLLPWLDLLDNVDVARWLARFPRPLAEAGAAVLQIDHVGRDREARGRFAIGAQHKLAGVDVAYALDVLEPFGRGRDGKVKVTVAKDRPGHVRQIAGEGAKVAEIRLASHPEGAVSIEVVPPSGETDVVAFRPTALMERVSRAIEDAPGLSKNAIRSTVAGKSDYKDLALELLVSESYAEARRDGQAHHHFSLRPFRTGDTA